MLIDELEINLQGDLADAFSGKQFSLHYQPQVDIRSGLIIGGEALVRWTHPTHGMISPNQFIPMVEESGLMPDLGEWVLHAACEQIHTCSVATHIPLRVAVNLSPLQLEKPNFVQKVINTLLDTSLQPEQLELEIPEQLFLTFSKQQSTILNKVRSFGVGVVLEDVGRSPAEPTYLMWAKIDKIKFDPLLVRQAHLDTAVQRRIHSMIQNARSRDVKILAEGIETQQQFEWIRSQNIDEAQGYYFGRPEPANVICAEYSTLFEYSLPSSHKSERRAQ